MKARCTDKCKVSTKPQNVICEEIQVTHPLLQVVICKRYHLDVILSGTDFHLYRTMTWIFNAFSLMCTSAFYPVLLSNKSQQNCSLCLQPGQLIQNTVS